MSFYPPGWDYDRVLNASDDDIMSLTDEQHTVLFNGLREAGLFDYVMEVTEKRDREARAATEAQKPEDERLAHREVLSPYLDTLKNVFKFTDEWSDWGFVLFRTCSYGPAHEVRWAQFRARWDEIMEDEIAGYHNYHPKLDQAIELRKCRWVEDPSLDGASPQDVARRFAEIWPNLPRGYSTSVCLMVTSQVLESVMHSPLPSSAPQEQRKKLPFVIAVSRIAHEVAIDHSMESLDDETRPQPRTSFRVAVESLMGDLYGITALDIMDISELTSGIKHEKDTWCHAYSSGIRRYEQNP